MASIRIQSIERSFGSVLAVAGVSLDLRDGELFTLLGPSGCGKTTLLRMVAGFYEPSKGEIYFGERRVDTVPPHRRNTGMVFQNYAVFPNLSVAGNIAYGLKARRVPPADIRDRVQRALRLVHLEGYGERWPHQLSGGQLQRVAIARALVIEPEVLLLDEPLSNLDAQLRVEMRSEIRELQQSLKITAVYVTHDQEEALAISDRIAVMSAGRIEQVGTPREIYEKPRTPFVAEFLGTTNLLEGELTHVNGAGSRVRVGGCDFELGPVSGQPGDRVSFSLRPEALRPIAEGAPVSPGWSIVTARIDRIEFLGALTRIDAALPCGTPLRLASLEIPESAGLGSILTLAYHPARICTFPVTAGRG